MDEYEELRQRAASRHDEEIYDLLKAYRHHPKHKEASPETRMCYDIRLQTHPARAMDERPEYLPFPRRYIQELHDGLGNAGLAGAWHVPWATNGKTYVDKAYPDDFRTVITFNTIEFMIRPPTPLRRDGTEPINAQ